VQPTLRVATQGDTVVVHEANERGRWISATGAAFPTHTVGDGFPRPHDGALFFRHDLDAWYTWDEASRTWNLVGGAAGSTPTGTGFRHVTAGVEDAAAKLVENADVDAAAAIVESKLALNFATHSPANDPTAGEKAALAGTSGAPGAGNPYVTDADARNTNARTPTAHTHTKADITDFAHAASHQNGGGDEISVAGLSGLLADAQTPLAHSITAGHNGFPGGGTTFLRDDGTFAVPPGGSGADEDAQLLGYAAMMGF
jgi:hypothetical protein